MHINNSRASGGTYIVHSLEEYLRTGLIPQGLRVQIFPAWEASPEFKTTWEKGLHQCSKILMSMLVEHDRVLLTQVKARIKDLESKLTTFEADKVQLAKEKLWETIEKYEKKIVSGKKYKFSRNKEDHERQRTFKWRHTGNKRVVQDKKIATATPSSSQSENF